MRVNVCGAGVGGLTLAWWLRQSGWDVLIVDDATRSRGKGHHLVHVSNLGYEVIARMGLITQLRSIERPVHEVSFVDANGRARAILRDPEPLWPATVLRRDLERLLRTELHGRVTITAGATVRTIRQNADEIGVVLSDGSREYADLLVGADGLHSRVRRLVFGPDDTVVRPLGVDTSSYLFEDDTLDRHLRDRRVVLSVPGRQASIYPTGNGVVAVLLTHRSTDQLSGRGAARRVRDVYGGMGWIIDDILSHCPQDPYYDQIAQVHLERWSSGRVTLVGDAGHAVSSLTGQNASLTMASAFALTVALYEEPDITRALLRFEADMRPVVREHQNRARRTAKWSAPRRRWHIMTRDVAFTALDLLGVARLPRPALSHVQSIAPL